MLACSFPVRHFVDQIFSVTSNVMDESIFEQTIADAAAQRRSVLSEIESKRILEALGVATQMPEPARNGYQAATIAARCGFPVVLKVLSPDATHKSDFGGVELGLGSQAEVRDAFERIRGNLAKALRARDSTESRWRRWRGRGSNCWWASPAIPSSGRW